MKNVRHEIQKEIIIKVKEMINLEEKDKLDLKNTKLNKNKSKNIGSKKKYFSRIFFLLFFLFLLHIF